MSFFIARAFSKLRDKTNYAENGRTWSRDFTYFLLARYLGPHTLNSYENNFDSCYVHFSAFTFSSALDEIVSLCLLMLFLPKTTQNANWASEGMTN